MNLLAMNSLHKSHVLTKQNRSSRQSRCVATSNQRVPFLSPFVMCYKCFIAHKAGLEATGKVKTFKNTVLELL